MRILQVIHDFVPETMAGAEINTHKLSVDLHQRHGHEVAVFCRGWNTECEPYRERDEQLDGLFVRRVDFGRGGDRTRWKRHDPKLDAALRRMIEQFRPDIVHIQHFIYLSTNIVAVAKEYGVPVVVSLRNFWFRCPWGTLLYHDDSLCHRKPGTNCLSCLWPDRIQRRRDVIPWRQLNPLMIAAYEQFGDRTPLPGAVADIMPSLATWEEEFRAALLKADRLHSPSYFLKRQLVDFGIPDEHVAVVSNSFRYDPRRVVAKQPAERLRIGMIGMHRLKGLHVMIDAFRQLPRDSARLVVYGQVANKRYAEEQQQRAAGYDVEFRGTYRQDELYEVFGELDVLVVPSIWYENCPTVILEAYATGTPVIAADIGGMAEMVRDGVDGMHFAAGDASSLAAKLMKLVERPETVQTMARNIRPPLTVEQCTDGIHAIYDQIVEVSAHA
jgi:glycosyltransferase involved in cell wall biosynthesis